MAVGLRRPRPNPYAPQGHLGYGGQEIIPFIGQEDIPVPLGVGEVGPETQSPPQLIKPIEANESDFLSRAVGVSGGQQEEAQDYPSESAIARQLKMAQAMREQGAQGGEVQHPLQALGYATKQIVGSWQENKAAKQQEELEKRRRDALKGALGQGGDLNALADNLMNSPDPALVERGLELKLKLATADKRRGGAPTIHEFTEGDQTVAKQWNDETGSWDEVSRGPRYKPLGGGGGSGGKDDPSALDEETLTYMAEQYMAGDRSVLTNLGRGIQGARNVVALRKKIAQMGREVDPATGKPRLTPRQLAAAGGELQGYAAYQRTSGVQEARMRTAAQEARNIGRDVSVFNRDLKRSDYRGINVVGNEFRAQTGDVRIVRLTAALNSFVNTYARAINPTGQPTVHDKDHARGMISRAMSEGQLDAALDVLDREMQNAIAAPREAREARGEEFYSGDEEGPQPAPPLQSQAKPPADGDRKTINGKTYVRKGGRWYPEQ